MSADYTALSKAHMAQQVGHVAEFQAKLATLWDRTVDPADLDGSYKRFQVGASVLIKSARERGELTAQEYYDSAKALAGYTKPSPKVPSQPPQPLADRLALHATGLANAKRQIGQGVPPAVALERAKVAVLRSAKRRVLEAPRQRLIHLATTDKDARGWARVSDDKPCAFCAMLVSRGPVYTAKTAGFPAHDGCGCNVRPVFKNDPEQGWSPDARALKDAYKASLGSDAVSWRAYYDKIGSAASAVDVAAPRPLRDLLSGETDRARMMQAAQERHPDTQFEGWDARGLDTDAVRAALSQISDLLDAHPAAVLSYAKPLSIRKVGVIAQVRSYKSMAAGKPGMEVSTAFLRDPAKLRAAIEHSNKGGHFHDVNTDNPWGHVISHEFGHVLDANLDYALRGKIRRWREDALRARGVAPYSAEGASIVKSELSGYGNSSFAELVAEVFGEGYVEGVDHMTPLAATLYKHILDERKGTP